MRGDGPPVVASLPRRGPAGPGREVAEFQATVRALHAAGLEVLLDVVYNHTGEGNEHGPTLCHLATAMPRLASRATTTALVPWAPA